MINRIPTSYLPKRAPSEISSVGYCRVLGLWLLLAALALWANTSRAATAVVTFTNFPAAVSNTYSGIITLQINGLTNGVTNVVVQKYLDLNTNGIIDGNDLLVQQFQLTVGKAASFTNGSTTVTITNFMPGDSTLTTTGQITVPLNFQNGDFMQNLAGQYLYKISSPLGQFATSTNLFTVTNNFYTSAVSGSVFNATSLTNVPYDVVLLFSQQTLAVQAGAVANSNGVFIIRAPPGNYWLAAAKTNFVSDLEATPVSILLNRTNSGAQISLTPATTNVMGRVVSTVTNTIVIPGVAGMVESTNNLLSLYFTDTNGNFIAPVTSNEWIAPVNGFAANFEGYLTWQTNLFFNVSNKVVNLTNALAPETAIFYGVVTNNLGSPMPGVYVYAVDDAAHQAQAMTDSHGNYVLAALGGTNLWQMGVQGFNNPGFMNTSNVSDPQFLITNINTGQAIQQNFGLNSAPYSISGTVSDVNGNPLTGVLVFATATNGYEAFSTTTAANGTYSLSISPGFWTVGLDTNSLIGLGFTNVSDFPSPVFTNLVTGGSAVINFSLLVCGEIGIITTNLPSAMVGVPYLATLLAQSCQAISSWRPAYGVTLTGLFDQTNATYPPGTAIYSNARLVGYLESSFTFGLNKTTPVMTNISGTWTVTGPSTGKFVNLSATVNVTGPITNIIGIQFATVANPFGSGTVWTASPTTQSGSSYITTLTLSSYPFTFNNGYQSYNVFPGLLMTASGTSNTVGTVVGHFSSLATGNSVNIASTISYTGTGNAVVWIQSGTNLGQYLISADGPQSTNLPPGLQLFPNGMLAGTPTSIGTNGGVFNFTVAAEDTASNIAVQPLSLMVFPVTTMSAFSAPFTNNTVLSSNLFQMQINGVLAGENYTLLMSTNLPSTNWIPIFTTNTPNTNSFIIPDFNATNPSRFYRIQVGP